MGIISENLDRKHAEGYIFFNIVEIKEIEPRDVAHQQKLEQNDVNIMVLTRQPANKFERKYYIAGKFKYDENNEIQVNSIVIRKLLNLIRYTKANVDIDKYGRFQKIEEVDGKRLFKECSHKEFVEELNRAAQRITHETFVTYLYYDENNRLTTTPYFYPNDEQGRKRIAKDVDFFVKNVKSVVKSFQPDDDIIVE